MHHHKDATRLNPCCVVNPLLHRNIKGRIAFPQKRERLALQHVPQMRRNRICDTTPSPFS
ncbi:Kelch-like protein X [Isosphaera pallida ATCC 43644]|uniref:Kelch-like protein X n=1 Tax=Isosphaera pallida (strain ATCC 43644 / DSM 9630 / IS1B) TaxID=575540 RepID=E8R1Z9_ISOPI|nr:Kelch-like protein X [Isosphaera pallida ATCC 43644]